MQRLRPAGAPPDSVESSLDSNFFNEFKAFEAEIAPGNQTPLSASFAAPSYQPPIANGTRVRESTLFYLSVD